MNKLWRKILEKAIFGQLNCRKVSLPSTKKLDLTIWDRQIEHWGSWRNVESSTNTRHIKQQFKPNSSDLHYSRYCWATLKCCSMKNYLFSIPVFTEASFLNYMKLNIFNLMILVGPFEKYLPNRSKRL